MREQLSEEQLASREGAVRKAIVLADKVAAGEESAAREKARVWLATDTPPAAAAAGIARTPLHWPLMFPEVFDGAASTR